MEDIAKHLLLTDYVKCFQNKAEDETHFICDCSCYDSERFKLFDYIKQETLNFASLNSSDKMIWLMTCEYS